MNQNDCSGKTLKLWPVFVDRYIISFNFYVLQHSLKTHLLNNIIIALLFLHSWVLDRVTFIFVEDVFNQKLTPQKRDK